MREINESSLEPEDEFELIMNIIACRGGLLNLLAEREMRQGIQEAPLVWVLFNKNCRRPHSYIQYIAASLKKVSSRVSN